MRGPLISVIVPIYNAEEHLDDCLRSLIGQTYEDMEIIAVNDGSTDGTPDILQKYESEYGVRVLHKENGGASSARNRGIEEAKGKFFAFADCDDRLEPDMYEYLMREALSSGADIVQCAAFLDYPDREEITHSPSERITVSSSADMTKRFFGSLAFSTWSKIYRAEVIKGLRYDQGFLIGEDLYFNLHALVRSGLTVLLPEPKYHYIQREGSICCSAPSLRSLTAFRDMARRAAEDFSAHGKISRFIFDENLKNNADIASKIVLSGAEEFLPLFGEIVKDTRRCFPAALFSGGLPFKMKLKLLLIAAFPGIYKKLLLRAKQEKQ